MQCQIMTAVDPISDSSTSRVFSRIHVDFVVQSLWSVVSGSGSGGLVFYGL